MADFIHSRDYYSGGDIVVLDCDTQCNFFLVDDQNFQRYRNSDKFEYYGNFFKMFPARITVPHDGHWNAIIDLGGGRANIRYSLSAIKR
jgi:hypothetical protein